MHMISYLQDGQLTLALTGEIDHHRAKELIQTVENKIEAYLPIDENPVFEDLKIITLKAEIDE